MKIHRSMYPWLAWLCLIWILSSLPSQDLPSIKVIGIDKVAHIAIYAILGLLIIPWLKQMKISGKSSLYVYVALMLLAAFDEMHQTFIPGRSVSIFDWFANSIGLSLAYLVFRLKHDRS
ncbi:MAG: hypothetical protein CVU50_08620 [Candidatus Cloacimonetes bacterium HGW-Cloacimonetes-3]|jgi:VanZ family protein|nr:MAG: hypothetical protein CVU50_08620 [Candidatus Cloacimonetes bacterium HGW-Cloacimonetes-3]